jgi:hypothetical protein
MPDVKMVPIDAYHWPLTEPPVEVRQAIESWCAELKPVFLTDCCSEGVYDSRDGGGRVASGTATEMPVDTRRARKMRAGVLDSTLSPFSEA